MHVGQIRAYLTHDSGDRYWCRGGTVPDAALKTSDAADRWPRCKRRLVSMGQALISLFLKT